MTKSFKEIEERYKALFNSTICSVYIHDLEGNFLDANNTALKLFGYKKRALPFLNISSLLDKKQLYTALKTIDEIKKTGSLTEPKIYKVKKKNGEYVWMEVVATLIHRKGKPYAIQGIAKDITKSKLIEIALRRSEEKYRTMIETMNEGLSVVDKNGVITFVNDQFCDMTGYFKDELLGKHETVLLDEENQKILKKNWSVRKRGDASKYEITLTRKDGEKIYTLVAPRPIFDEKGRFNGSFGIFTNISILKQAEIELIHYQERLRSLVLELSLVEERERRYITMELQDYINQTLVYCRNKLTELKEFSSNKDIKNPLKELQDLIEHTIQYTNTMTYELSTPILYEKGLEAGLKWLGENFQGKHNFTFHFEDDLKPKPLNDETRILLYKAVRELLNNIVKHARAKNVKVSIERDYKNVRINVDDDGIGFNTSKIDSYINKKNVFGLFSIYERLKYLGGHLNIESSPGHGTHITMILPLKPVKKKIGWIQTR